MASLLDPDPGLLSGPLLPVGDVTPDVLRPDPQADALGQMYSTISDYMTRQQAESARMGLWDDQTGLPTSKGLLDAIGQTGTAVALGTGGGGDAPGPGFTAYHGSPHLFPPTARNPLGEFDPAKIGTGEGAQAYGVGAGYLADAESVAKGYRDALTPQNIPNPEFQAIQREYNNADSALGEAASRGTDAEFDAARAARDAAREKLNGVPAVIPNPVQQGHMYEVNVNADPDHFLDWDKPLNQQSDHVRQAIANSPLAGYENTNLPGGQIVPHTHAGAQALASYGIPGIRYLDQGSRGAGEGTKNSVVFDPATMDIIRRYGLAGLMAGGGAAALGGQTGQQQ